MEPVKKRMLISTIAIGAAVLSVLAVFWLASPRVPDARTTLKHGDDQVKIWEMALAPGEETAPHEHKHNYILVIIEGDRIAGVPHNFSYSI